MAFRFHVEVGLVVEWGIRWRLRWAGVIGRGSKHCGLM